MCTDRARNNYNSGMGEIFRRVASISPVETSACDKVGQALIGDGCDAQPPKRGGEAM